MLANQPCVKALLRRTRDDEKNCCGRMKPSITTAWKMRQVAAILKQRSSDILERNGTVAVADLVDKSAK
jgi:hypothetical protein